MDERLTAAARREARAHQEDSVVRLFLRLGRKMKFMRSRGNENCLSLFVTMSCIISWCMRDDILRTELSPTKTGNCRVSSEHTQDQQMSPMQLWTQSWMKTPVDTHSLGVVGCVWIMGCQNKLLKDERCHLTLLHRPMMSSSSVCTKSAA